MSTRLVILGLLRDRRLYGYEIKHIIEDHMGDWTSIAFGSIYFALRKLTEEDYVERVATETHGDNPARIIYQITDSGRDEFLRLLRDNWTKPERQYFAFDIGLFFMDALPRDEVIEYLHQREAHLDQALEHLETHRAEQMANPKVLRRARAIFDHTVMHCGAELDWTRRLLESVERGEY